MTQKIFEASKFDDIGRRLAEAQVKTWKALDQIAAQIKPGLDEQTAIKIAQSTLAEMGSRKFWHKCHIRFGADTTKSFNDEYQNQILKDEDIFYVDIGPIWDGIEGDAGNTYIVGENQRYRKCQADVRSLFKTVSEKWRSTGLSGKGLYQFAESEAEKLGWLLAPSYVRGHRLSEFPHSFHTEIHLDQLEFQPSPQRWVLEMHICDPELKFGAFYEDLLF